MYSNIGLTCCETLPLIKVRQLSEKVQEQPEYQSDKDKKAEFSIPSWMVKVKETVQHPLLDGKG